MLEAVLTYARDELGAPIEVPVLYGSALSYVDREELRGSRAMLVDDACRTGKSLALLRATVARYEVADIQALACIGLDSDEPDRHRVDCYRNVDEALYQQYVWQLTELVVSRGLPPEVDHFLFELRFPDRLSITWRQLQALLTEYGELTVDGPANRRDELQPMTLHFPRLPGLRGRLDVAPHRDGPIKSRFPDQAGERAFAVPISLPALSLEVPEGEDVPLDQARRKLREALGWANPLGELLLAEAEALSRRRSSEPSRLAWRSSWCERCASCWERASRVSRCLSKRSRSAASTGRTRASRSRAASAVRCSARPPRATCGGRSARRE